METAFYFPVLLETTLLFGYFGWKMLTQSNGPKVTNEYNSAC
jgi:hypothetical protein